MNTAWHFPIMILVSLLVFFVILRIVLTKEFYQKKMGKIVLLSLFVVVVGMCFGKYGAGTGLPWWVYYPIPMLMTVFLPPLILKLNSRQTAIYLVLSFLSAPFIHFIFSFFLGWQEYMPFWKIAYIGELL